MRRLDGVRVRHRRRRVVRRPQVVNEHTREHLQDVVATQLVLRRIGRDVAEDASEDVGHGLHLLAQRHPGLRRPRPDLPDEINPSCQGQPSQRGVVDLPRGRARRRGVAPERWRGNALGPGATRHATRVVVAAAASTASATTGRRRRTTAAATATARRGWGRGGRGVWSMARGRVREPSTSAIAPRVRAREHGWISWRPPSTHGARRTGVDGRSPDALRWVDPRALSAGEKAEVRDLGPRRRSPLGPRMRREVPRRQSGVVRHPVRARGRPRDVMLGCRRRWSRHHGCGGVLEHGGAWNRR